jgi:nucleoside-diphosphate kinase
MTYSTFILLKPDALKRNLKEEIIDFFKNKDFDVVRENEVKVDSDKILRHYQEVIERIGSEDFRQAVLSEFVDETVHIVELAHGKRDVVAWVRDLIGSTDPATARPDTIRGCMVRTLCQKPERPIGCCAILFMLPTVMTMF